MRRSCRYAHRQEETLCRARQQLSRSLLEKTLSVFDSSSEGEPNSAASPWSMTKTLSASMIVCSLWAMMMMVQVENSSLMVCCMRASVSVSIDAVASSKQITCDNTKTPQESAYFNLCRVSLEALMLVGCECTSDNFQIAVISLLTARTSIRSYHASLTSSILLLISNESRMCRLHCKQQTVFSTAETVGSPHFSLLKAMKPAKQIIQKEDNSMCQRLALECRSKARAIATSCFWPADKGAPPSESTMSRP